MSHKQENNQILGLFFTFGVSLGTWDDVGSLEREIKPYKELARHFKLIYLFTYGGSKDLEFQKMLPSNIKIFPKKFNLPNWLYSIFLPYFYRKEIKQIDVLKTNQMSGSWVAVFIKQLYKKKLVVRCGYEWLNVLEKESKALWKRIFVTQIEKLAYREADKIIFTSQKDKLFAEKRFKIFPEKITIIPNYIDTNLFKPIPNNPNFPKHPKFLYLGRLSREKNLFNLIEAVAGVGEKLTLIGDGLLEAELKQFAKEKGAMVEFKSRVANEDLPQELNKAKVFVLVSFYEGSPKALLEAMACGLCCIGSDVEGINEVIKHKQNGYLTATDSEQIKKALQEVLADNDLQQRLGQSARETIIQRFALKHILEKEMNLYKNL